MAFAVLIAGLALPGCGGGSSPHTTATTAGATTAGATTAGATTTSPANATTATTATGTARGTAVDDTKLPLGDGKYTTTPTKGSVDSCITQFNGGGAFRDGPWIDSTAKTWNVTAKIAVNGSVSWAGKITTTIEGSNLVISGNGLPTTPTGVYPVASSDPAYSYDRNPNSIKGYTLEVKLPANPTVAAKPTCVGGTIGMSILGVPIFSAFDAGGRDAPAHEVQDACGGHPQMDGQYHFHSLSPCLHDTAGIDSGLFGYALDGFGIYAESGVSTADLDECHGRVSEITWHQQKVSMYHYVATHDFPYLVGCYKGTPITSATGLQIGRP